MFTSGDHMEQHGATNTLRLLQVGARVASRGAGRALTPAPVPPQPAWTAGWRAVRRSQCRHYGNRGPPRRLAPPAGSAAIGAVDARPHAGGRMKIHIASWLVAGRSCPGMRRTPVRWNRWTPSTRTSAATSPSSIRRCAAIPRPTQGNEIDLDRDLDLAQGNAIAYVGLDLAAVGPTTSSASTTTRNDASAERRIHRDIRVQRHHVPRPSPPSTPNRPSIPTRPITSGGPPTTENWAARPPLGRGLVPLGPGNPGCDRDANGNQVSEQPARGASRRTCRSRAWAASWRWVPAGNAAWRLRADGGWFAANVRKGWTPTCGSAGSGVEWFPWENWGFSLDYTARKIKGDSSIRAISMGNIDFLDSGIRLGAVYRF